MHHHDDFLARPPGGMPRAAGLTAAVATLALLTSGCSLMRPSTPAAAPVCVSPPPAPAPVAAPPPPPPAVVRTAARPAYVKPVLPPLPADVYPTATKAAPKRAG